MEGFLGSRLSDLFYGAKKIFLCFIVNFNHIVYTSYLQLISRVDEIYLVLLQEAIDHSSDLFYGEGSLRNWEIGAL